MSRKIIIGAVIAASILFGMLISIQSGLIDNIRAQNGSRAEGNLSEKRDKLHKEISAYNTEALQVFAKVAEMAQPSVVHISVEKKVAVKDNPFFRKDLPFLPAPPPRQKREFRQQGEGSGMVISKDGYLITNNHVVQGSVAISVHLWDKRTFEAEVTGTDEASDIALLKILNPGDEQIEFVPVMFGDSSRVRIGEWVIAIGNPLGLENTLTVGVVSAKGRSKVIPRPGIYENFIQTDAAINKGNSGGPLFNLNGQVIGMNTAIWTDSSVHHGSIGLGFAIPADMIKYVVKQLKDKGTVSRGWLGVRISDVTPEVAKELDLDINKSDSMKGAYIPHVFENSPAERGGLKKGDIIIDVNGKQIESASHLQSEIAMTPIGSAADITVLRRGEREILKVTIGNREQAIAAVDTGMNPAFFGMKLRSLSKKEAERFGADRECVQVIEVARDSIAQKAGIEPLDIIMKIGHTPISSVAEFRQEIRKNSIDTGIPLVILDNEGLHAAELKKE